MELAYSTLVILKILGTAKRNCLITVVYFQEKLGNIKLNLGHLASDWFIIDKLIKVKLCISGIK